MADPKDNPDLVDDGDDNDDDNEHTVVVSRAAPEAASPDADGPAVEDDDEHTVMVERTAAPTPAVAVAVAVAEDEDDEDEDEHTVMVDRSAAPPATAAAEDDGADDDDEHTVVVDKRKPAKKGAAAAAAAADDDDDDDDEHTVVVGKRKPAGKAAAADDDDEHTVVVDKSKGSKPSLAKRPANKRRRGIAEPPVPAGFSPKAVDAIGPGAEEVFAPRAIPDAPATPAAVEQGPDATRMPAPHMPSVLRQGRHLARRSMIAFIVSCTVSVIGLTVIAFAVF